MSTTDAVLALVHTLMQEGQAPMIICQPIIIWDMEENPKQGIMIHIGKPW